MKRREWAAFLILLLMSGCAKEPEKPEGAYPVYYAVTGEAAASQAVDFEYRVLPEGREPLSALVELVMAAPEDENLASPVSAVPGLYLRTATLDEGGRAHLDFSEQYEGLSDIGLTVANACFTLTLCSLDEVESVYITVEGKPIPYQAIPVLREGDWLLSGADAEGALEQETDRINETD